MTKPVCSIEGCGKAAYAFALCSMHYTRRRRGQDVSTSFRQRAKDVSVEEVVRLYTVDKLSTVKLAARFGIADVTVSKMLKSHGVEIRGIRGPRVAARRVRKTLDQPLIVATYKAIDYMSVAGMARLHKTSIGTIKNILAANNIAIRPVTEVRHTGKWKSGSLSPFWNPNRTDEERKKTRSTIEVTHWRRNVYARDGFECQACGATGVRLEAHHIESWGTCPDKRFDVSNGITFCKPCHVEFHKRFGKRHNNKTQLAEFVTPAMEIAA